MVDSFFKIMKKLLVANLLPAMPVANLQNKRKPESFLGVGLGFEPSTLYLLYFNI